MNKEWLKSTAGVMGFVAVALLTSYVMQSPAQADMDSTERNPGTDKVTEDKVTEDTVTGLGATMKLWAMGLGAGVERGAIESKKAFLDDVDRFQQSEFWQYQVNSWAQGKEDLAKTQESIKQLPQTLARVPGDIATGLGDFVRAVTGVKNANEQK